MLNWHKITWDIIKGTATKESASFHREQSKEDDLPGKTKGYILLNMPLIHPLSCECIKSELDLFGVPLTQTSVEEGRWVEYRPITAVKDSDDTIEFKIAETDSEYIDLKNSFIRVKAKIVNAEGELLNAKFWLHALFSQIDMTLKDTLVTTSNNTYLYKA